jgi:aspartyl-tRNA(Asn)/glutamyl-tRNA(Gln) amidotransferase subunit B
MTTSMRGKEEAHDYRYFPDPDLIPVVIDEEWVEDIRQTLPELPAERKERFIKDLGLPHYDAEVLTSDKELADYFEAALAVYPQAKKLSNWMMTELMRELKGEDSIDIGGCPISPENLGGLLDLIDRGTISGKIAKAVFLDMMASGKDAETLVQEKNLVQVSDEGELLAMVQEIIAANPDQAAEYRAGKTKLMGYFVGQLMQKTKGKANPKLANKLFSQELDRE